MLRGNNASDSNPEPPCATLCQTGEQQQENQTQRRDHQPPPKLPDPPNLPKPPPDLADPPNLPNPSPEVPNQPNAQDLEPNPRPSTGAEERKEPAQKSRDTGTRPLESHESHETEGRHKTKKGFFRSRPPWVSLDEKLLGGSTQKGGWYGGGKLDVVKDDLFKSSVRGWGFPFSISGVGEA